MHSYAPSSRQQNRPRRADGHLIGSYASSGKPCPVSGKRQGAMTIFGWLATLATSVPPADTCDIFWRALAEQQSTAPSTLPLLVRGRLFGGLEPTTFRTNHPDGYNPGTPQIAYSSALGPTERNSFQYAEDWLLLVHNHYHNY